MQVPSFLRDCLRGSITNSQEVEVKCPFMDNQYQCDAIISEREIRGVRKHDLELNTPDHNNNTLDLNTCDLNTPDLYTCDLNTLDINTPYYHSVPFHLLMQNVTKTM